MQIFRTSNAGSSWYLGIQTSTPVDFSGHYAGTPMPYCNSLLIANGNILVSNISGIYFAPLSSFEIPLPIELEAFTATVRTNGNVRLKWTTLSESTNYGFEVWRSGNSKDEFHKISSLLPGHGSSTTAYQYEFIDRLATTVERFYRLRQINLDGTHKDSDPVFATDAMGKAGAVDIPNEWSLSQNYPNPFNPSTMIKYGLPRRSEVTLTIYNSLGQRVVQLVDEEEDAGYHEVTFDGSSLASEVYFFRLQAGSFVKTMKLLLLR